MLVRSDTELTRLLTGLYNLPKLQELVLAVATAKIMVLHIDIERQKIVCVRFVMCLLLVPGFQSFFFMQPKTVLMKQTRQAVYAIKQSIYLDAYCASRQTQNK